MARTPKNHVSHHPSVTAHKRTQEHNENNMPFMGTFFTTVISSDAATETVKVAAVVGDENRNTEFAYPFNSKNGWIRGLPEDGTKMVSVLGGDSKKIHAITYYDPLKSEQATAYEIAATGLRNDPESSPLNLSGVGYRTLQPGEIDLGSRFAQTHMGYEHWWAARGGLSHLTLNNEMTEIETVQFKVSGPIHEKTASLNDELRFGAVRRARNGISTPTSPSFIREGGEIVGVSGNATGGSGAFAKEWSVILDWKGEPSRLLDHRQGIVLDDEGHVQKHKETNAPLRAFMQWGTTNDGTTMVQVDEQGNTLLQTSKAANEGLFVTVPAGNMRVKTEKGQQYVAREDIAFEVDKTYRLKSRQGFYLQSEGKGELKTADQLEIRSGGVIQIKSESQYGIQMGTAKSPIMLADANYITTYKQMLNSLGTFCASVTATLTSAGILVASLGDSASGAAQGGILTAKINQHLATINQGQAISVDVKSS